MKNPSLFSSEILFHFFIFFTLKVLSFTTQTIPYSDHCQSFAPEAIPTDKVFTRYPFLEPVTSHYTGGQNILDQDELSQRSIVFAATQNLFKTNVVDTYKIQARLSFFSSNIYYRPSNFSYTNSNYSRVGWKYRRPLVFHLDGFWSVSTSRLCMVGSAYWYSKEGNPLKLDAVLKLKFARFITLNTSLVSGILESLVSPDDSNYFDSISMLGFPRVSHFKYNYTSVSNEECNGVENKTLEDSVTSMPSLDICGLFKRRFTTYKLEYPSICKNCSLFGLDSGYLPSFVSLYAIQCSPDAQKLRFLVEFKDRRYTPYDQSFNPDISLIGDGTWSETKDELCIVACHILNKSDPLGSARVGDCSIRLSLWFLKVRSIKKTHTTEGQIWSTKTTHEIKSFKAGVKFRSFDHSQENYGWKYEYTQMEKARQICPSEKNAKRKGDMYQSEHYGDFHFDMLVKHKNMGSTGSAVPIFVGDWLYNSQRIVATNFSQSTLADVSTSSYKGPLNISYEISFRLNSRFLSRSGISSLNLSSTNGRVRISAEGFYDDESARICMVGCRNLNSENSYFDCEIQVIIQLPQGNGTFVKGSIHSLREKTDALYFEHLDFLSLTYSQNVARKTIWRMDLEIIMVLISDTLACVFIGQQLFHLNKRPEMANLISVLMMLILTFGHMVPLVLNFEAMFRDGRDLKNIPFGDKGGWLELNEVVVRIVTMVAFILQFRLLQITWAAKKDHWIHEIWTLVICLPMYIIGGTVMFLVNWKNNNHSIDLRSYAGLTLDGFLFPQIILNIFQVSTGNALSYSFYIGTTFVRLLPHVYDLYRGPNSIGHQFDRLYIYANPRADFYSSGWDIIIVCGGIVFAGILLLQQRFGGRLNLPKIFGREFVEYEMVPVASNEG